MKTREEMNELFADVPEALSNTLEILDKVEYYSIDHAPIILPSLFLKTSEQKKDIVPNIRRKTCSMSLHRTKMVMWC